MQTCKTLFNFAMFYKQEEKNMEEELSLDNILGAEEIENLFVEDGETQDTPPANGEPHKKEEEPSKDKE